MKDDFDDYDDLEIAVLENLCQAIKKDYAITDDEGDDDLWSVDEWFGMTNPNLGHSANASSSDASASETSTTKQTAASLADQRWHNLYQEVMDEYQLLVTATQGAYQDLLTIPQQNWDQHDLGQVTALMSHQGQQEFLRNNEAQLLLAYQDKTKLAQETEAQLASLMTSFWSWLQLAIASNPSLVAPNLTTTTNQDEGNFYLDASSASQDLFGIQLATKLRGFSISSLLGNDDAVAAILDDISRQINSEAYHNAAASFANLRDLYPDSSLLRGQLVAQHQDSAMAYFLANVLAQQTAQQHEIRLTNHALPSAIAKQDGAGDATVASSAPNSVVTTEASTNASTVARAIDLEELSRSYFELINKALMLGRFDKANYNALQTTPQAEQLFNLADKFGLGLEVAQAGDYPNAGAVAQQASDASNVAELIQARPVAADLVNNQVFFNYRDPKLSQALSQAVAKLQQQSNYHLTQSLLLLPVSRNASAVALEQVASDATTARANAGVNQATGAKATKTAKATTATKATKAKINTS